MGEKTLISWCDATWNPWLGCDKVSPGCKNCYIVNTPPLRIRGMKHGDDRVQQSEAVWRMPFKLNRKPWVCSKCGEIGNFVGFPRIGNPVHLGCGGSVRRQRIFTLSLGDWLDPKIPVEWLARMLDTMRLCPDVDFLTVTKRLEFWSQRLLEVATGGNVMNDRERDLMLWAINWVQGNYPKNVWVIGSAENQEMADKRIPELLRIPAVVHGLSCEPLLGPIDLTSDAIEAEMRDTLPDAMIDWVITGGESGKGARPCNVEWIRSIKDQCAAANVPCFVKQLGKRVIWRDNPTEIIGGKLDGLVVPNYELRSLKHKKGGDINEWPADLRVQQWPKGRA